MKDLLGADKAKDGHRGTEGLASTIDDMGVELTIRGKGRRLTPAEKKKMTITSGYQAVLPQSLAATD